MLHTNLDVNEYGHLTFAGHDTVDLANTYGTPLMVLDEARIRENMRQYKAAMRDFFGGDSRPAFASKALSCKYIYRLAKEEGLAIDLVSSGELYTALAAGFDVKNAFFHGNNKTDADIAYALDNGVGTFVVDNLTELDRIDEMAGERGLIPSVLLRLTPGIDPHTHAAVATGKVDSKFGLAIETGQADKAVAYSLQKKHIALRGFHCHIGSQIFELAPFREAAKRMIAYVAHVKATFGMVTEILNLGGGFGVRYVDCQPILDYRAFLSQMAEYVKKEVADGGLVMPTVIIEPGRSIVADAGLTLYSVGGTKEIPGFKNYVSVDGGMADNPRYALYQSEYTVCLASRMNDPADYLCTVAGRCCESGDLLQEEVLLPKPKRDDVLAVLVTGAYNYSMASNYNRLPRPMMVAVRGEETVPVIRRETLADLVSNDL